MRSIGQNALISRCVERYGLGDTQKYPNKSTTSIDRKRLFRAIAMKVSKGLEFPVVALPGVGHMHPVEEDEKEAARVFYVVATRVTQRFVMGVGGNGKFISKLSFLN